MRSMTGYGAATAQAKTARLAVEIRSVNQRFLDVKIAAPREYAAWEAEVRDRVRARVDRGRVDVAVTRTPAAARRRWDVAVREELARAYVDAGRRLAASHRLAGGIALGDLMRLPELFEVNEHPPDVAGELPALRRAMDAALRAFDRERAREGRNLQRDMAARTQAIRHATAEIRRRLPAVQAAIRQRVEERLARLADNVELDPSRAAHEVAMLADRSDVSEELVRLDSHLGGLAAAIRATGPVGKRIEFLLQEIQRELNTTGAKASDLTVNTLVLGAKAEVEKLREQVQNVE